MITFVTLFLGLFLGTQPVELRVDEDVAAVELVLDGEPLGRLEGPPWSGQLDLGQDLAPHHLEAVAFDADGGELSRAERWINLPRPPAEVSLFLETAEDGTRTARIFWETVLGTQPETLRMELDGQPLPGADLSGAVLPPLDEGTIHFVRAEVDFPDNVSTSAELVFGGGFQDAVDTDLTAVPLEAVRDLTPRSLQGRLVRVGGPAKDPSEEPLSVVAVEEGGIDLVFVPDAGAISRLRNLALEWESHSSLRTVYRTTQVPRDEEIRRTLPLPKEQRVRFLWPFPQIRLGERGIPFNLFVSTPELTNDDGGLVWLMSRTLPPGGLAQDPHLSTAVAVAGSVAAARNRRRAVVVLWTGGAGDRSAIPPETVRRYLADLRVPLHVWTLEEDAGASPWGEPEEAFNLVKLDRAFRRLSRTLARQRIAWVSGTLLPQRIRLDAETPELSLARSPAPRETEAGGPGPSFQPDRKAPASPTGVARDASTRPKVQETQRTETKPVKTLPEVAKPVQGPSLYDLGRPRREIAVEEGVRLRVVPDASAPHLAVVDAPAELPEVERRGDWARVTYRGRSGWVHLSADGTARPEQIAPLPPPEVPGVEPARGELAARQRTERRARAESLLGSKSATLGAYDLLTDVEDEELLSALDRLTGSVAAAFESRFGLPTAPPGPGEAIVLFRWEVDYRAFASEEAEDLAALDLAAHAGGGLAALFIAERDQEQVAALLVHELTHLTTDRTLGADLPPWLEEGLADDLAFSRIDRDGRLIPGTLGGSTALREERRSLGRGRVRIEQEREISGARASLLRLAELVDRGGLPSLRELTALSQEELLRSDRRDLLYPMSAFFIRFLLDREGTSGAFREFLAGVTSAADADGERLVAHLGTDWGRLQRGFESWLRSEARRLPPG